MIRITRGNIKHNKHKKILRLTKGFFSVNSRLFRIANTKIFKAFLFSYIGRKQKKRQFRQLWITRINAALNKKKYSDFIAKCKKNKIKLNRKILSQIAILDPTGFMYLT